MGTGWRLRAIMGIWRGSTSSFVFHQHHLSWGSTLDSNDSTHIDAPLSSFSLGSTSSFESHKININTITINREKNRGRDRVDRTGYRGQDSTSHRGQDRKGHRGQDKTSWTRHHGQDRTSWTGLRRTKDNLRKEPMSPDLKSPDLTLFDPSPSNLMFPNPMFHNLMFPNLMFLNLRLPDAISNDFTSPDLIHSTVP
jgi:hypothetical protein